MKNCEHIQAMLPEFPKGCLQASDQELVENHLDQCPACQLEFQTELELMAGLGGLPHFQCPQQVTDDILLQIDFEQKQSHTKNRSWLLGTSTLVAAGLALVLLLPSGDKTISPEPYSTAEIQMASQEARWALAKVVTVINHNENNAFKQVFGQEINGAVGGSLRHITKNLQGEV